MKRKVAIYARVSTEHEAQLSALDNQVQYYDDILKKNPDWILYDRYIDEGITGTSTKKRKNFMRMMEDAKAGRFDLIVTREVSRFARNTVDTLQETRKLKNIGVEVYFIEDNIWTFNDEDGELKLTIMATLAQNESKKTSQRVKAGQMISFQNGVFYGTGNILGYNKTGKDLVVNEEQAEIVKFIYSEYLSGKGTVKIADELTKILMEGVKLEENEEKNIKNEIKRYQRMITEENEKQDRLLDMYLDGTVDLPTFEEFHKKYGSKIETYKVEIDELEKSLKYLEPIQVKKEKAMESVKKILDIGYNGIDERLIEEVVEKIIVHENYFEWKLNFYDDTFKLKIVGKGEKNSFIEEYKGEND